MADCGSLFSLFLVCYVIIVSSSTLAKNAPVILVSMDGMGWQFPGGQYANTPNLDFIAETGVKAKYMETVTPTKTWPNHQTYVTGLYPESHGMVSNVFWDPVIKEKFVFEYDCSNFDPKFWSEAEPLWLTLQKQGIDTAVYFWPGFSSYNVKPTYYEKPICLINCTTIKDLAAARKPIRKTFPPYDHCYPNYSIPFPSRIDSIVNWLTSDKPPRFVAFYVDQPDWIGHAYGWKSQNFKKEIEKVDNNTVGYLISKLRKADLLDEVNLVFVADHSFADVNKSRVIFLEDFLDLSSSMITEAGAYAHIWPKEGMFDEVYANLTKLMKHLPLGKLYKKDETPIEWHYRNNRRIPPIYVDAGLGWMFYKKRTTLSDDYIYGTHGWPAGKRMGSIFYARGPSFKKGFKVDHGLRSIDVYPMLCDILGIQPRPHNGSLANMKMMLVDDDKPTPKATGNIFVQFEGLLLIALICSYIH